MEQATAPITNDTMFLVAMLSAMHMAVLLLLALLLMTKHDTKRERCPHGCAGKFTEIELAHHLRRGPGRTGACKINNPMLAPEGRQLQPSLQGAQPKHTVINVQAPTPPEAALQPAPIDMDTEFVFMARSMQKHRGLSYSDIMRLLDYINKLKADPTKLSITTLQQYKDFCDDLIMNAKDGCVLQQTLLTACMQARQSTPYHSSCTLMPQVAKY